MIEVVVNNDVKEYILMKECIRGSDLCKALLFHQPPVETIYRKSRVKDCVVCTTLQKEYQTLNIIEWKMSALVSKKLP